MIKHMKHMSTILLSIDVCLKKIFVRGSADWLKDLMCYDRMIIILHSKLHFIFVFLNIIPFIDNNLKKRKFLPPFILCVVIFG